MEYAHPQTILAQACKSLLPPPDVTGSEWAEQYRVLSSEDSGAPGRWDLSARPFQNEIMDCACDSIHEYTSVIGPSQWGKTAVGLNIIGYIIHINPGPAMVVHPTISAAQKYSKTRFAPMVRDCPILDHLVAPEKSRDKSNTILEKSFPGGLLINVGANAPAGLASQPVKYLIFEELDRVPVDVQAGEEGDYETLAIARTTDANYIQSRKIYRSSSPTLLGASRIERAWKESDMRQWHITCPHCQHDQVLKWESVVYEDDYPEGACYQCLGGCAILEPELRRAVRQGHWVALRPEVKNHAGFWINGLMVRPMAYIVAEFLEARKSGSIKLQTWKNTCLGELYNTREGEEAKVEGMMKRCKDEKYKSGEIPDGVGILTAGIDVQTANPQRLEIVVRGTGIGYEQWTIQHKVIVGNLVTPDPWDQLDEFLLQDFVRQDGKVMTIRAASIDTGGHFRTETLKFRKRESMKGLLYPIKGASRFQRNPCVRAKTRYALWMLDTVQIKDHVYGNLTVEKAGPRYQHFPNDTDQRYFDQLLAERPVHKEGKRGYEPYPKDAKTEILDCTVYSDAALTISGPWKLEDLVAFYTGNKAKKAKPKAIEPVLKQIEEFSEEIIPDEDSPVPVEITELPGKIKKGRPVRRPRTIRIQRNVRGW